MNAIDTNVLVYAFDADEPRKQAIAVALLNDLVKRPESTVLLWQVACEFWSCLRRWNALGRLTAEDVDDHMQEVLALFSLVTPNSETLTRAFDLTSRFSLSHWDGLLLAACIEAGANVLYTEDLQAGGIYDSVNAVNPFQPTVRPS